MTKHLRISEDFIPDFKLTYEFNSKDRLTYLSLK